MNSQRKPKTRSFYSKCDVQREKSCITCLKSFAAELCRYHMQLEGQLKKWTSRLDQLTVAAMKLHILAGNEQEGFVVYDEHVAENVASEMSAQQKQILIELQSDIRTFSESFISLRKSYDALKESTENIDWNVNSPLITGDLHLTPLDVILTEACNIMFYFKVFLENLEEKVICVAIHPTEHACVKKLLDNTRISIGFMKSFEEFLAVCQKQFDRYKK